MGRHVQSRVEYAGSAAETAAYTPTISDSLAGHGQHGLQGGGVEAVRRCKSGATGGRFVNESMCPELERRPCTAPHGPQRAALPGSALSDGGDRGRIESSDDVA